MYYESKELHKKALELLKKVGNPKERPKEGIRNKEDLSASHTIDYLSKLDNRNISLILEFSRWVSFDQLFLFPLFPLFPLFLLFLLFLLFPFFFLFLLFLLFPLFLLFLLFSLFYSFFSFLRSTLTFLFN